MKLRLPWTKSKCERKGHDWFPGLLGSEYVAHTDVCLRAGCLAKRHSLPWGTCLGIGEVPKRPDFIHPLSAHYTLDHATDTLIVTPWKRCPDPK